MRTKQTGPPISPPASPPPAQSPTPPKQLSPEEHGEVKAFLDASDKPFSIAVAPLSRKRKRGAPMQIQHNPFDERLSVQYEVKPKAKWESLRRYKKFTLGSEKVATGQCILVKNDSSYDAPIDVEAQWKAVVLEVRALDSEHVYIRVAWLNRPEDLAGGRKDHHGQLELLPTNEMDIIDAMTVNGAIDVVHWEEKDDNSAMMDSDQFFWRQTYDCAFTKTFSDLRNICVDEKPQNPDEIIVMCPNSECRKWLHAKCIAEAALKRAVIEERDNKSSAQSVAVRQKPPTSSDEPERNATVTVSQPKKNPRNYVHLYVAGEPSGPELEPATKSELVLITPSLGRRTEPVLCLFCNAAIDSVA
ncbi:hypothetical protein K431DRAFT_104226 [Polychaeton citri CBS 116435]|uniref:BAH domain-containing protein n=1 Tax=Polychaeton citri CBS 116435 TaxID=1314669 RepID=A0A9P4ULB6_9PEZI|nr:hypothetical protein K431DRAFT_104226 [Polychaeton citri CBS 116435]